MREIAGARESEGGGAGGGAGEGGGGEGGGGEGGGYSLHSMGANSDCPKASAMAWLGPVAGTMRLMASAKSVAPVW